MTSLVRLALSFLVIAMVMAVPARVAACSCMEQTLPDAVRGADVAFVGTLTGTDQPVPAAMQPEMGELVWSWDVERSRDKVDSAQIQLAAWPDNGANCGVSFGVGERWLVIAHQSEGRLSTSSCSMNQPLDGTQPEVEAQIAEMLTVVPAAEASEPAAEGFAPSVPVLFLIGAIAVLAVISAWAFLQRRPS